MKIEILVPKKGGLSFSLHTQLGGGLKHFLCSSLLGEDSHFDEYFSNGLKPPTRQTCHLHFGMLPLCEKDIIGIPQTYFGHVPNKCDDVCLAI